MVNGCQTQITLLDNLNSSLVPQEGDTWRKKTGKAILILHQDAKVAKITTTLRTHVQSLINYHVAASSRRTIIMGPRVSAGQIMSPLPRSTFWFQNCILVVIIKSNLLLLQTGLQLILLLTPCIYPIHRACAENTKRRVQIVSLFHNDPPTKSPLN